VKRARLQFGYVSDCFNVLEFIARVLMVNTLNSLKMATNARALRIARWQRQSSTKNIFLDCDNFARESQVLRDQHAPATDVFLELAFF